MLPFIYQTVKVMWKKTLLLIVCLSCLLRSTAQNLKFDKLTVEVGYQVGFSNPKYFSTCFKAEYGLTPSQYLLAGEKHKKES